MAYFPAFIQLDRMKVLIVGGGNIALEKLERLLDFTQEIHVIAPEISERMSEKMKEHGIGYEKRRYEKGDIRPYGMVIIAVDDIRLQAEIFEESKQFKCLCNAVDSVDYCDFIFPSYVKKDALTIAVSTSGTSPAFAKYLKRYLMELIPSNVSDFLSEMKELRSTLPKGKERMKILDKKAEEYIQSWSGVKND